MKYLIINIISFFIFVGLSFAHSKNKYDEKEKPHDYHHHQNNQNL